MILKDKKVLVQYSGGKDSTACLIKLLEDGVYVEAVHFTHEYAYELPTKEAKRICDEKKVKLHLIDVTEQIKDLFLNNFAQRPCRFCKGIMDSITVKIALQYGFEYICVGDTASDKTLVERIKETGEEDIMISRYFNKAVDLPENIRIVRPFIYYDNDDVFEYLNNHSVYVKRNNDTGDKYFEYSREGCPLQFKDYGVCYTQELMAKLKLANSLCSEFATINGIKASIHLPSEVVVTIPKGYENQCRNYLLENGFMLKNQYKMKNVSDVLCFSVTIYKEIFFSNKVEELFSRFLERLSEHVKGIDSRSDCLAIRSEYIEINCNLVKGENRIIGNIRSLKNIDKNFIESLFIELFHTYDFDIRRLKHCTHVVVEPIFPNVANCRYIACGKFDKRFIRSSCIDRIRVEDVFSLAQKGISTIIDLRNEKKCTKELIQTFSENGIQYFNLPFTGNNISDSKKTNKVDDVVDSYLSLVGQHENVKKIFKAIAEANAGVLIFCKYGKDRTGIIAMILELLCDMPMEAIIKDYIISELYLNANAYTNKIFNYSTDIPVKFIAEFNKRYESAYKYLLLVGFNKEEILKITNEKEE